MPEAISALLDIPIAGPAHMEAIIKQLDWEPDFFGVNEIDGFRVPKQFMPETMRPRARRLARFWAEICRFVLMQLGDDHSYGVGFIFAREIAAKYEVDEDNERWLMLNPYIEGNRVFHLSDRDDVSYLYALAVHECTHMANGISWHDEAFRGGADPELREDLGAHRAGLAHPAGAECRGRGRARRTHKAAAAGEKRTDGVTASRRLKSQVKPLFAAALARSPPCLHRALYVVHRHAGNRH